LATGGRQTERDESMDLAMKFNSVEAMRVYGDAASLCLKTIHMNYMSRTGRAWGFFAQWLEFERDIAEMNGENQFSKDSHRELIQNLGAWAPDEYLLLNQFCGKRSTNSHSRSKNMNANEQRIFLLSLQDSLAVIDGTDSEQLFMTTTAQPTSAGGGLFSETAASSTYQTVDCIMLSSELYKYRFVLRKAVAVRLAAVVG
jgi:hypothetical protein